MDRCAYGELLIWLSCFEKYLCDNNIPEHMKLQVVYQNLEGQMGMWIKRLWEKNSPSCWEEFKWMFQQETMEKTMEKSAKQTSQSRYWRIQQEGMVSEYRKSFEDICLRTMSVPGTCMEEVFLQGLKPPLQVAVHHLRPQGLVQIMDVAQWLEESDELIASERELATRTTSHFILNTVTGCLEANKRSINSGHKIREE